MAVSSVRPCVKRTSVSHVEGDGAGDQSPKSLRLAAAPQEPGEFQTGGHWMTSGIIFDKDTPPATPPVTLLLLT